MNPKEHSAESSKFIDKVQIPGKSLVDYYLAQLVNEKLGVTKQDIEDCQKKSKEVLHKIQQKFKEQSADIKVDVKKMVSNFLRGRNPATPFLGPAPPPWPWPWPAPPPPPAPQLVDIYYPANPTYIGCKGHAEGSGDGILAWAALDFSDDDSDRCENVWTFKYTPTVNGNFHFWSSILAGGAYYLIADDGTFSSKYASFSMECTIWISQTIQIPEIYQTPGGPTTKTFDYNGGALLFKESGAKISVQGSAVGAQVLETDFYLQANSEVKIAIKFQAIVWARGDDSVAHFDLSGTNGAVACTGLYIKQKS